MAIGKPGDKIGNHELVDLLREGGEGEVWRAWDTESSEYRALKIIRITDESVRSNAHRQFEILKGLPAHQNIAKYYSFDEQDDIAYFSMELHSGSLRDLITQKSSIEITEAVQIFSQICNGISHLHNNNVIHRDLNPANILIDNNNSPKITDFGIARSTVSSGRAPQTEVIGTRGYMSPEQERGADLGRESDIYSLGIILYEMLKGHIPLVADNPISVSVTGLTSEQDESLSNVIIRATRNAPDQRFHSATDMAEAITAAISTTRQPPPPQSTAPQSTSSWTTTPTVVFGGIVLAIIVASLGLGMFLLNRDDPESIVDEYKLLAREFATWKAQWIQINGDPPFTMEGAFSGSIPVYIPICGVVTGHGGLGFKGLDPSDSLKLDYQTIVLAGTHKLKGSIWTQRGYTIEIRPPTILGEGSITKEYNKQLRKFLDSCHMSDHIIESASVTQQQKTRSVEAPQTLPKTNREEVNPDYPVPTPTEVYERQDNLDDSEIYRSLVGRFKNWKLNWVNEFGEPPFRVRGNFSSKAIVSIPMCGVITVDSGRGYYYFEPSQSHNLGSEVVAISGDIVLTGNLISTRDYTVQVVPPKIELEFITREYSEQLRRFLDLCEASIPTPEVLPDAISPSLDDPIGHWKLDETSGETALDTSKYQNTGTLINRVQWVNGKSNNALLFDGSPSYVNVPDSPSLRLSNMQTLSIWYKWDGTGNNWRRLVGKGDYYDRNYGLWIRPESNAVLFQIYEQGGKRGCQVLDNTKQFDNNWHHLAGTYDGTTLQLYYDGYLSSQHSCSIIPANSSHPVTIGFANHQPWGDSDNSPFGGILDEIKIYNRVLSACEIAQAASTPCK